MKMNEKIIGSPLAKKLTSLAMENGYVFDVQNSSYIKLSDTEVYCTLYFDRNKDFNKYLPSISYNERDGWACEAVGYGKLSIEDFHKYACAMQMADELITSIENEVKVIDFDLKEEDLW